VITLTQLAQSTEPIQFSVQATQNGVPYNPTADPVFVAFAPESAPPPDPTAGEWNTAAWETDPGPVYWITILVGPLNGGVPLAQGSYIGYWKATDNPAVPVKAGCYLIIT
jgi:hypothetical protein